MNTPSSINFATRIALATLLLLTQGEDCGTTPTCPADTLCSEWYASGPNCYERIKGTAYSCDSDLTDGVDHRCFDTRDWPEEYKPADTYACLAVVCDATSCIDDDSSCNDDTCLNAEAGPVCLSVPKEEEFLACRTLNGNSGVCVETSPGTVECNTTDPCLREGFGRMNCCTDAECASASDWATVCPNPMLPASGGPEVECDPTGASKPNGENGPSQSGHCVEVDVEGIAPVGTTAACVWDSGPCAGVVCEDGFDCSRSTCDPGTGFCKSELSVRVSPYCDGIDRNDIGARTCRPQRDCRPINTLCGAGPDSTDPQCCDQVSNCPGTGLCWTSETKEGADCFAIIDGDLSTVPGVCSAIENEGDPLESRVVCLAQACAIEEPPGSGEWIARDCADDGLECTVEACDPHTGECTHTPVPDYTFCDGRTGVCFAAGTASSFCQPLPNPQVHPCTEQGVAAAAVGGAVRHIFSCGTPTTIAVSEALNLGNGVILDGEGLLTIEGTGIGNPTSISVGSAEVGELRNIALSGVYVSNRGQLTLASVAMTASRAVRNYPAADLTVVNSSLTGNAASPPDYAGGPEYGGALRNQGVAAVAGTTLSGNVAADFGGAIYSSGVLTIDASVISSNSTNDQGGGIYLSGGSSASITNTTISENTAAGEGGGVYVSASQFATDVTIAGGAIADNFAGNAGGGVFSKSDLTIDGGAVVSGNEATTGRGGGIFQDSNALLVIKDSEVRDNSSGNDGGGIVVEGSLVLERTVVQTNAAAGEGGGIQVGSAGDVSVADASAITQNVAGGSGGGVRVFRGTLAVLDSTVDGNQAGAVGGGVSSYGDTSGTTVVNIERSTISGNIADGYGGGIESQWSRNTLTVTESAIVGNASTTAGGGGVYVQDGAAATITNSTLAQNTSAVGGGAVRVNDAATVLNVTHCTFGENTTGTSGEAIALVSGTVSIQNSLLANTCNTALTSLGGNIEAGSNSCGFSGPGDALVTPASLNLTPLGLNGGPTSNYLPQSGSSAIDFSSCTVEVVTEQRGLNARPQGSACDCGAVEAP